MADAELALRLRSEALIAGFADLGIEEAVRALLDVEAVADALAATGAMDPHAAGELVADTVDALAVRGASWVDPAAVDLDVRRLHEFAAGVARPRLRRVVPVASAGGLTSVDLWDARAEVRVAGGPSLHLDAVAPDDRALELRDGGGGVVTIDLSGGRAASDGGSVTRVDVTEYLARLEAHASSVVRRDGSVRTRNEQRRRVIAVATAFGDPELVSRFDAEISAVADEEGSATSTVVEVVPVAVRAPFGWVLSVERWSDHWRAVVVAEGRALWAAVDDAGARYGGDAVDAEVVRFDPALPEEWTGVVLQRLDRDGRSVEVEVRR